MILTCPECGRQFEPRKAWQKYCDRDCNQTAYLKRKLEKKRANPLHVLDLDLGPSPVQEAEYKRRSELADEFNESERASTEQQRKAKAEAVVKKMEELEQETNAIEDWYKK